VIQIANGKDGNRTQNFTYDALNRIQQAYTNGPNWGETFGPLATGPGVAPATPGIDAWGNLTNRSGVTGKTLTEALSCPASANNQLTTCFTYDAAGNLIQNGTATYTYDAENRIITTAGTSYIYDGDGQRIEKCTAGATAGTCSATATGTYYWKQGDGGTIAETDLHGNWTTAYGIIRGKIASRVDLPANTLHYYFNDHLGTTSVVTSAAGVVQKESDYFPYGGEIAIVSGDANRYKFTGKERDSESGLDMFGARYYSSSLGRFITPDWAAKATAVPYANFGNPQSLNLYSYVQNNPTTVGDPDGHLRPITVEDLDRLAAKVWKAIDGTVKGVENFYDKNAINIGTAIMLGGTAMASGGEDPEELEVDEERMMMQQRQVAPAEPSASPNEGVYEFPDAKAPGKTYVGQSGDMPSRLEQHTRSGKLEEGANVKTTPVAGGKTTREVAETDRIKELGGKSSVPGSQTSNQRNPVSDKRMEKIKNGSQQ
jgi:RHS repeat-associated protein